MPTFHEVYTGTAEKLRLCVCVGATDAKREDFNVAVWELDRHWLLKIMVSIADHHNSYNRSRKLAEITPEQAAVMCDEEGIENRFFRLNGMVAEWIDSTPPLQELAIDYIVM